MASLSIRLLGDFHLSIGDRSLNAVSMPRVQELAAFLAMHRDAPQTRQRIAFLFWPDANEDQARTNLRKVLLYLRQVVPEIEDYLGMQGQLLFWRPDAPIATDVAEFERAAAQAQAAADPRSARRSRPTVSRLCFAPPGPETLGWPCICRSWRKWPRPFGKATRRRSRWPRPGV